MTVAINLNADRGESFGAYNIGNDDAILTIIRSPSIACGFHAGDPDVMHKVVRRVEEKGVSVGCHPGCNDDCRGFGRRIDRRSDDKYMGPIRSVPFRLWPLMSARTLRN